MTKITPAQRAVLLRLNGARDRGIMLLALLGSGGNAKSVLRSLIDAGWAEPCVVQLSRDAVPGARITTDGAAAIGESMT